MFAVNLIFFLDFTFQQATNINMTDHELVYQERVLKITDDLQQLNIVDGSELDLQGTLKLLKPRKRTMRCDKKYLKLNKK